jgi:very-short-patch-repair endonuclease
MTSIASKLESSRQTLLDLSTRNRLINIPQNSKQAKIIEVVDELSTETYRLLVKEDKSLSFLPGREKKKITPEEGQEKTIEDEDDSDFGELPQPEDDATDDRGISKRHSDHRLQTLLTSEGLQKRLLSLFYDAITFEEEQGVNILYLALGMLKWYEDDNSKIERCAPLVLIPVSLKRGSATEKFKIKWRNEEPAANLSLQAKMKLEFGIVIPDLPEDEDFDIQQYFQTVQEAVSAKSRFNVEKNKIVLGFFSFAKFLMYRDLDASNWPENSSIDKNALIAGLVQDGFSTAEGMIDEDAHIDEHLPIDRIFHVVDADSSQTLAIEEVRRGRNLVIQGPPGTGKSQTITNVIASAVKDGKKVLFVAEKMAALEVVQRRMNNIGLGPLCFELHSSKSNKRNVLEELKRTRDLSRPKSHDGEGATSRLQDLREKLNAHALTLHKLHTPSRLTAYQIMGNLVHLKDKGVEARGYILDAPETWSPQDKKEKEELLADIASRIREIGIPAKHIWRGVNRSQLLPNEYDKLIEQFSTLQTQFGILSGDIAVVEKLFSPNSIGLRSFKEAQSISDAVSSMPEADHKALAYPAWYSDRKLLEEVIETGLHLKKLKEKLSNTISDAAMSTDLQDCRLQLAMHGESIVRHFKSSYKQSVSLLKSVLTIELPKSNQERLALIDDILNMQRLEKKLHEQEQEGKFAFGHLWQSQRTDWAKLSDIISWCNNLSNFELPEGFLISCSKISDLSNWNSLSNKLASNVPAFFVTVSSLFGVLNLDIPVAFDETKSIDDIDRDNLLQRVIDWGQGTETLSKWISFKTQFNKLEANGLKVFASKLWDGTMNPDSALETFRRAYFDAMSEIVFTDHSQLRDFDGEHHYNNVVNFRANDNYRIEQARIELRGKHYNEMPRSEGGIGPLGVLNGEFAKKRNHLPLRQLIKKAGPAIQALKPIFMMSPLSVAQFLEPGCMEFDLLVIDEASQVEPVDALGAVARAKQIVVVGDTRQLPPTRFFSRVTGNIPDEDNDDDTTTATQDVESILSLCLARGLPQRMLRWHYRSKHQSLIAVSNKEFYENKLFIIPSPYDAASGMGLKFNFLPNGIYDSGGTSANQIEAKAVAEAVIQHAKNSPQLSLGIGTFSMKQKQAIIDELELLRRKHPETESFFSGEHPNEPFFVKNLENIQGDERDVILISVGYGKNQNGYMAMRFGPLSNDGGERRLNVLISRAKRKCEVYSSITADDIDLERAKGAGVASLKLFLKFAQTGKLDYSKTTEREPDSVFEEQVASALRAKGFDVKTQIGLAGFFIDLAIVDPDRPGRFLLGIECDGANYHSSRSARDRDRLRQSVLEDHGWIIHRIWSTDWFRRPNEQLDKVLEAIEQAKQTLALYEQEPVHHQSRGIFEITANDDVLTITVGEKELSTLYKEAIVQVPLHIEPHEMFDNDMALIVTKIVEAEAPIHENEIITRVRSLWNLSRAGNRIQSKVKASLKSAAKRGWVTAEGEFYLFPGVEIQVRDRSLASASLKKVDALPPQEIKRAIYLLIEANFGAGRDQVAVEVARLLGFKSTSSQLKDLIERELNSLIETQVVVENEGFLRVQDK